MISHELYNKNGRRWVYFGRDPSKPETLIDTNEYLVVNNGQGLLPDPGGVEIFPPFVSALTRVIKIQDIKIIFASHQDPDIVSSLPFWTGLNDEIEVYCPWVWGQFIPHFGGGRPLISIPDEGCALPLGGSDALVCIPCHYVHSSGQFMLYDAEAKILFSSDTGAALLPPDYDSIFVKNFDTHIPYMEGFHKRWLPSNHAKNDLIQRLRTLDIDMMCPQHGAIFRKEQITQFLDWLEELDVGSAVPENPGAAS